MTQRAPRSRSPKHITPTGPVRHVLRGMRAVIIALVLGVVAYWLFTDSFLTRRLVTSSLRNVFVTGTGSAGEVTVGAVRVQPGGRVQITDLSVRAAGLSGRPGDVLRVPRIDMEVDLKGAAFGTPHIRSMLLDKPTLVLSRDSATGEVNIAGLAKAMTRSGNGAFSSDAVPSIIVSQGTIELGEHGPSAYAILKEFHVSGEIIKSKDASGEAQIRFRQIENAPAVEGGERGISVEGTIGPESVALVMHGMSFSALSPNQTPSQLRELFERADFAGGIPTAELTYTYKGAWNAALTLKDVALNLPVEVQPDEDREGNPLPMTEGAAGRSMRLQRTSGKLLLAPTGLAGTLEGFLEELPYEVSFRTQGLSATAPWTVTMITRGFRLEQEPEILKFTPGLVRRRLRDFSNPEGVLDAEITLAGEGSPVALPKEFVGPPVPPKKP